MFNPIDASGGGAIAATGGGTGVQMQLGAARLTAAGAAATATITDAAGVVVAVMGAAIGGCDSFEPAESINYVGPLTCTVGGAGAKLILYIR